MAQTTTGRVLSIQSHVAFGYVGGKAAVLPLQCLGYDVDVRSDSETPGYSHHDGSSFCDLGSQLGELL